MCEHAWCVGHTGLMLACDTLPFCCSFVRPVQLGLQFPRSMHICDYKDYYEEEKHEEKKKELLPWLPTASHGKIWETPLSWYAKCCLPVVVRVSKTRVPKLSIDWRLDNLSGSHHLCNVSRWYKHSGRWCDWSTKSCCYWSTVSSATMLLVINNQVVDVIGQPSRDVIGRPSVKPQCHWLWRLFLVFSWLDLERIREKVASNKFPKHQCSIKRIKLRKRIWTDLAQSWRSIICNTQGSPTYFKN